MFIVLFTAWGYETDSVQYDVDKKFGKELIKVDETGYTSRKITMRAYVPESCAKTQKEANKIFTDMGLKLR